MFQNKVKDRDVFHLSSVDTVFFFKIVDSDIEENRPLLSTLDGDRLP